MNKKYLTVISFAALFSVSVAVSVGAMVLSDGRKSIEAPPTEAVDGTKDNQYIDLGKETAPEYVVTTAQDKDKPFELLKNEETALDPAYIGGNNSNMGADGYELDGKSVTTIFDTETTEAETTEPSPENIPQNKPPVTPPQTTVNHPVSVPVTEPATEPAETSPQDEITTEADNSQSEPVTETQVPVELTDAP